MSGTPRLLALCGALTVSGMLAAAPAAAHVRVDEGHQPPKGGYGIVRLIVPTESQQASTVALTVTLPQDVDLSSARTLPVPGWTASVETEGAGERARVSRISWRAVNKDGGVKPSEFGEFTFSAGPWPENVDTVALLSDQTYSDGSVVSWNEIAVDTDTEPEHPAPTVTLSAPDHTHGGDGHGAQQGPAPGDTTLIAAAPAVGESWWWRATSLVSLVVALSTAAALAVVLRRRS
ncbi:hypothetical protein A5761_27105 [Mycolicibacterium setense]|uniref:YcnI family copper-binding membrane protein n=1 Tax=Mycolicibacterium setense TaxID=431269 RepID=UPI0007EA30F3|nr:YcnI family protein [Mycolicibacterium setense]OBB10463.1 hypothetical protein A5761_27105 [Mycolicibacterium setense]